MASVVERVELDTFVAVDWSANGAPKAGRDSIWVALATTDGWRPATPLTANPRTRHAATAELRGFLREAVEAGRRVLVGTDFPHGYPRGTAAALGLGSGAPWRALWDELARLVEDDDHNRSNRLAVAAALNRRIAADVSGPFWGRPATLARTDPHTAADLPARRNGVVDFPVAGLAEWRAVEAVLREGTPWRPMSVWQTYGVSVGSQTLTGLPRLASLRDDPDLRDRSRVWPFETGFADDLPAAGPLIVHAEVWPRPLEDRFDPALVPDQAQVDAVVAWLAEHATAGTLGDLLAAPPGLGDRERAAVLAEEGWVLGVT